ncbi:alpha/beta hydrolase family protein [Streptomyces sp. NBC_00264]|uniref:alpha/beta hydrolase n=1 Tax=unclassified Streptomyces TaxID=2593676 RepID=UPI002253D50E|nr:MULTISPECIES: alpha/beta hydrolase [unclassified Streptomyces]MCX4394746.1 alpha/beta hydrolase family protein [Streptomyces sp. NBC_01767]MCX5162185.1 alpha/beta hydrolase family protein [Streptomyces sp. NBC_00305]MCX5220702.1 alpha/beta hydrolase family protein [Streptomyces sp. NBC_00264]
MATEPGLTWQRFRDLKLSELTDAADGWRAASAFADAARERVDGDMGGRLTKTQDSESARAAVKRLKRLSANYHYIHTETGLVRGALDGLATELGAPQRRLRDALDDAASLGYTVNDSGSIDYPAGGKNDLTGDPHPGGSVVGNNGLIGAGNPGLYRDANGMLDPAPAPGTPALKSPNPHRAKAQDVADRLAHAMREAHEIDARYSSALHKLKAAPGLTVDTRTWADVGSDADAVSQAAQNYLEKQLPLDKSPAERKEWWDHLSQEQRDEYLSAFPGVIGNLDGIPATARDEANRENLQLLIGQLGVKHDDASREMLGGLKGIQEKLEEGGEPPMYLLGIGDEGNGRAIIAYGNPDTADNVSAYVPGLGTKLDADFAGGTVNRALQTALGAHHVDQSSRTSSIVWLGYDAPQTTPGDLASGKSVMFTNDAEAGAPDYNAFMAGISATHEGGNPHVTAIGHSYGSLTVGLAAQEKGGIPGADDIILVGSPGTGADNAQDLNVGKDHVYVGAADNDIVTKLPNHAEASGMASGAVGGGSAGFVLGAGMAGPPGALFGGGVGALVGGIAGYNAQDAQTDPSEHWFGTDPASESFGATRFMVDDGATIIEDRGKMSAHSNYFNPNEDQESADNIAKIVAGKSEEIKLETPR